VPPALAVAALLTLVEAVVLVVQGVVILPATSGQRLVMAATTTAFFLVFGAFLGYCAWQLYRLRSWARAPVVLAQLIIILVGGSFWGGSTRVVAVLMILAGAVTIAGIMTPASLRAVEQVD
jgi:peptidoglycan/LPS O-acetylase OafA/YrhL